MGLYYVLVQLAGSTALLIWAVRTVRTGVERIYGPALSRRLRSGSTSRLRAIALGVVAATLLQSSTAVAMLAVGFAGSGLLPGVIGLSILLGADVGSALVVRILSFDLSWLTPLLLVAGAWMFLKSEVRKTRQIGRVLVGVALILISIRMIGDATAPLRDGRLSPEVVDYLLGDAIAAFLFGALFTWLLHSSVAAVLLVATLVAQSIIPGELGVTLVLGANLGAGLIAVGLSRGAPPEGRRIPIGNLLFRAVGAIGALLAVTLGDAFARAGIDPATLSVVTVHLVFNVAVAALGAPFAPLVESVARLLAPDQAKPLEEAGSQLLTTSVLDRSVVGSSRPALASATRELLRIGGIVEIMFRPIMQLYESGDLERIKQIQSLDQAVNKGHSDIMLYLAEVSRGGLGKDEARRCSKLQSFSVNLEYGGDIIVKNLLDLARTRDKKQLRFSEDGWRELTDLHGRVLSNMQLSLNVLVTEDRDLARQLVEEKTDVRDRSLRSLNLHIERLRRGGSASQDTSNLHLETIQAFRQINSLFAAVAYPVLQESGDLLDSRLAAVEDT